MRDAIRGGAGVKVIASSEVEVNLLKEFLLKEGERDTDVVSGCILIQNNLPTT